MSLIENQNLQWYTLHRHLNYTVCASMEAVAIMNFKMK